MRYGLGEWVVGYMHEPASILFLLSTIKLSINTNAHCQSNVQPTGCTNNLLLLLTPCTVHACAHIINSFIVPAVDVCEFEVVRVYMGTLMTSLEMAGISLTLLNHADSWTHSLGNVHTILGLFLKLPLIVHNLCCENVRFLFLDSVAL